MTKIVYLMIMLLEALSQLKTAVLAERPQLPLRCCLERTFCQLKIDTNLSALSLTAFAT